MKADLRVFFVLESKGFCHGELPVEIPQLV